MGHGDKRISGSLQPDSLECVGANNTKGALIQTRLMSKVIDKVSFRPLGMCCSMLVHAVACWCVSHKTDMHTHHTHKIINKQTSGIDLKIN